MAFGEDRLVMIKLVLLDSVEAIALYRLCPQQHRAKRIAVGVDNRVGEVRYAIIRGVGYSILIIIDREHRRYADQATCHIAAAGLGIARDRIQPANGIIGVRLIFLPLIETADRHVERPILGRRKA